MVDSRKWIGTTEVAAVLSSLWAKCRLVDFHRPTGPGGTHPALFEWVRDYFGGPRAQSTLKLRVLGSNGPRGGSIQTGKIPLYLQHEGKVYMADVLVATRPKFLTELSNILSLLLLRTSFSNK